MHDIESSPHDQDIILYQLKKSRLFNHIPDELLQEVLPMATLLSFPKNTTVLEEGQPNTKIYFLIEGQTSILSGTENILTLKRTGDIFGEMSIISNHHCSATVIAMTDIRTIVIDAKKIGDYSQIHSKQLKNMLYQIFSMILTDKLNLTTHKAQKFEQAHHELLQAKIKLQTMHHALQQRHQELKCEISEKINSEKKRIQLESELRQSKKIEALGTLAGGIAHDFNNILSSIMANTEMFMMSTTDHHNTLYLEHVVQSCKRATELTQQILTFSRMEPTQVEHVDVATVLQEALHMIYATLPKNIHIKLNIHIGCGNIIANATQIHQIIINLCTNAKHALQHHGGTIMITLQETTYPTKQEDTLNPYLKLSVRDNGIGIPRETIDKIFDPFFTTKEMGIGTGLGLSVIHGIVKKHRGEIHVQSILGEGTTFDIYFPLVEKHPPVQHL